MTSSRTVAQVLDSRRARGGGQRRLGGLVAATVLHVVVIAAAAFLPRLLRKPAVPVEYVAVKLMPAPAQRSRAAAAPARPSATPAAKPAPTPEPQNTPEPPPAEPEPSRPTLPDPNARRPATAVRPAAPAPTPGPAGGAPGASGPAMAASASVGGFDNPSFTYGYYVDRMLALIRAQWSRPPLGGELELIVHFRIATDGTVLGARLVKSSGYNAFDLAGLRAVQAASPLPPLPRSFREDSIGVHLIFR